MNRKRTPSAVAQLLILNAKHYESERNREVTRYRFSANTLRRIADRVALRESFISDLSDALAELGWLFISVDKTSDFAVMDSTKIESWVKLSSKRLAESGVLHASDEMIENEYSKLFLPIDECDEELDLDYT